MNITNNHNLPPALVRACGRNLHRGENYSASMLGNTPQMVWLKRRHEDELTEDVSTAVKRMLGTALHKVIEGNGEPGDIMEYYMETEPLPGVKLSGSMDLYSIQKKKITDWKTTSAWTIFWGSRMGEWEAQVNTYAHMARKYGLVVNELEIVAFLLDWDKKQVGSGKYPKMQVVVIPLTLWPPEKCEAYIKERVSLLEGCKDTPDEKLPPCTKEEIWDRGKGPVRCKDYCSCREVCGQYKAYIKAQGGK